MKGEYAVRRRSGKRPKRRAKVAIENLGLEVRILSNLIYNKLNQMTMETENLTIHQCWILQHLTDHAGGEVYQKDIEQLFSIKRSTANQMLKTMEVRGFIRRTISDEDARRHVLTVTEEGIEACGHLVPPQFFQAVGLYLLIIFLGYMPIVYGSASGYAHGYCLLSFSLSNITIGECCRKMKTIAPDLRAAKTMKKLRNALFHLLSSKTLDEISVKMLCQEASVNRSTFYAYFRSISELLDYFDERYIKKFCQDIRQQWDCAPGIRKYFLQLLQYIRT